eukprot:1143406-Pelagomonas_calceolata.AAC.8
MGIAGRFGTLADICDCSAFSQAVHQPHERRRRGSHDHVQDLPPGSKNLCLKSSNENLQGQAKRAKAAHRKGTATAWDEIGDKHAGRAEKL